MLSACTKISRNIGNLNKLRYFPENNLLMFYNAIIQPYFQYCNIAWSSSNSAMLRLFRFIQNRAVRIISHARGGGGGYSPQILVGTCMCRGKVKKMARAPERAPGRAWKWGSPERAWAVLSLKMGVSGTSLSRFELENGGLRNELEPFWAWKCGAPERPLARGAAERLKMRISRTAANPAALPNRLENANLRNGR